MNNALAAVQATEGQDPAKTYADARKLADVIERADAEEFISEIKTIANQTDPSAIFNFSGLWSGSLLHIAAAAKKYDILRLLLDHVSDHLIAAQNEWGDTPLHMAAKAGGSRAATMLICRARDLPNVEGNNRILRMKNKHGNTALHEAVFNGHVNMVRLLLREDLEPVYWKNVAGKSPLYLALDTNNSAIHEVLFSLSLEPSRIEGMPPVHGAIVRWDDELVAKILQWNKKLFAMIDSGGYNVFHLGAYIKWSPVFDILLPEIEYLARERDMNGDLPIHIAAKRGHVNLIKKLYPVSQLPNGQGQTVLHVAAKFGRASAVRQILRHPELGEHINAMDHDGNTPLHLAAMHAQPAALIHLLQDKRIRLTTSNNICLTAYNIAVECMAREHTIRNELAYMVLACSDIWESSVSDRDTLILRPEARDEKLVSPETKPDRDATRDFVNSRMVVAMLVATVTFAAGFAVPGGFNGSDMASKGDQGMATMLDKRMFQAFVICNTIAMFCSMIVVVILYLVRLNDVGAVASAYANSTLPLIIALPAMSVAFLTGVTLTISKLPWLANAIFYLGLVFLLIISVASLLQFPPLLVIGGLCCRRLVLGIILIYISLWGVDTSVYNDASKSKTNDSTAAKCGEAPHPPNH
ncbi:protein ACCELERATED CELL DEATH 6 [Eucalyptus grandis]|uniref:protein ACCELERATED CELL DEATH 6 n=1 Tax=Eucalyptus grandis TaxID=71139 RepID=UPI00192EE8E4|nr:protein ACCELERATED CELL DEATH 6 [Eucalyptus grandis]